MTSRSRPPTDEATYDRPQTDGLDKLYLYHFNLTFRDSLKLILYQRLNLSLNHIFSFFPTFLIFASEADPTPI